MLRTLVVLLLVANLAFYAWTQGWLDNVVGVHARGDHEPERLGRQINPELVKILAPQAVAVAASAAVRPRVCLEAGPFVAGEVTAAEVTLTPLLPAGSWANVKVDKPAVWAVYMGRYIDRDVKKKKTDELAQLNVPVEEVTGAPEFEPGSAKEGRAVLAAVSKASGGVERLAMADLFTASPESVTAVALAPVLVILALVLLGAEVVLRRFFAGQRTRKRAVVAGVAPVAEVASAQLPAQPPVAPKNALEEAMVRARKRTGR